MADFYSYAPEDVSITLAGVHTVEGVESDTFVNITKLLPIAEAKSTADGQVYRTIRADNTYDVELTLMQGSRSNEFLTILQQIDVLSGKGRFPIVIKDSSGNTSFYAASCWVQEMPNISFSGTNQTSRLWRLRATDAIVYVGSNSDDPLLSGDMATLVTALTALIS